MSTTEDLERQIENLQQDSIRGYAVQFRLQNALDWIRYLAGLHYMGDAFDPEHMRAIANIAADALNYSFKSSDSTEFEDEDRFLPDFEEATEKAKKKARKMANKFHKQLDESFKPYYGEEDDENDADDGDELPLEKDVDDAEPVR